MECEGQPLRKSRQLEWESRDLPGLGGPPILQIMVGKYFLHFCCYDYFSLRLMKPRKRRAMLHNNYNVHDVADNIFKYA